MLKRTSKKNLDGAIKRGKIEEQDKDAILSRIEFSSDLNNLKADVIVEAIIEKLDIKQELFTKLAEINNDDCILATNTSTIPITQIAYGVDKPGRVVGMHFFNPVHIMKLVEVIAGADTSDQTAQTIMALAEKLGKKAVMAKDAPGIYC